MAWTNFANLTNPNLPQLDANNLLLYGYCLIPCTISGTNTLTLTPPGVTLAPTLSAYTGSIVFGGIATATNTSSVTANAGSIGGLNVYIDTINGPSLLTGGEITIGNYVGFAYDPALNSNAGGFHLINGLWPRVLLSQKIGLTATGTNSATALALTAMVNVLSSVPSSTGVVLPDVLGISPSLAAAQITIFNRDAANAVNVFPTVAGAQIDALGAGAAYSLAHTKMQTFTQVAGGASGQWYSMQVG